MSQATPIDEEYYFEDKVIISQTDLHGEITYVNKAFREVSGYTQGELIGKPHSIVRHPDMPQTIFSSMWKTLKNGETWNGVIKNLRSDGRFYWTEEEILPIRDNNEQITGYIAVQRSAPRKEIAENEAAYKKILETQG